MKAMPTYDVTHNPAPMLYASGVVYTVQKDMEFKCLRVKGDKYNAYSKHWGNANTKREPCTTCIDAYDELNAEKRKKHT